MFIKCLTRSLNNYLSIFLSNLSQNVFVQVNIFQGFYQTSSSCQYQGKFVPSKPLRSFVCKHFLINLNLVIISCP